MLSFFFALYVQAKEKTDCFRVVEYNVENLFDVENDTLTLDDDFTPEGEYHWTYFRYRTKLNNIAKTIIAI